MSGDHLRQLTPSSMKKGSSFNFKSHQRVLPNLTTGSDSFNQLYTSKLLWEVHELPRTFQAGDHDQSHATHRRCAFSAHAVPAIGVTLF